MKQITKKLFIGALLFGSVMAENSDAAASGRRWGVEMVDHGSERGWPENASHPSVVRLSWPDAVSQAKLIEPSRLRQWAVEVQETVPRPYWPENMSHPSVRALSLPNIIISAAYIHPDRLPQWARDVRRLFRNIAR